MRNRLLIFFLSSLVVVNIAFGQNQIQVNPKIREVTVYLSGAEVRFSETIALKQGRNSILFNGLSPSLVEKSVQITVGNNVEVLSVSTQQDQLRLEEINPKLKILSDSIERINELISLINNQVDAYQIEKETLKQNQRISGAQVGTNLSELTKAADFFRERTLKINNALTALGKNTLRLNNRLNSRKEEYDREARKINSTRYSVRVTVNSKADLTAEFMLRHLVSEASWEASYDIVATEINKPVTLNYAAQIFNQSGIDWNNIKLTLSTGDVSLSATRPYLTAWVLNYTSNANEGYLNMITQNVIRNDSSTRTREEIATSELNTSFDIEEKHSIQADGQPYRIDLKKEKLNASFQYLTVPKMESSAFLIAKVTGWEKLNLIDGVANVYYGSTYVGESNINTRLIGDTLELSLGRDNQIVVSRTKVEDNGNTSTLGGKRIESFVYQIQIRNNHKSSVLIQIQDQIPVVQEKEITVEVDDISGARLDVPSGKLQWSKNLEAGEAVKYKIAFAVKYPKNKTVNIRKSRVVMTPRYRK